MSTKITITVKAKITAGTHPKYGRIVKGREYTIDENDFGEQLFNRPEGWAPPWEREVESTDETAPVTRHSSPVTASKRRK